MAEPDIELLRAALIVDRAVIQAILECLPAVAVSSVRANAESKLEQFTVRTLNSTMPEAFVDAQRATAEAWLAVLSRL